jgi:hypothetical protein
MANQSRFSACSLYVNMYIQKSIHSVPTSFVACLVDRPVKSAKWT